MQGLPAYLDKKLNDEIPRMYHTLCLVSTEENLWRQAEDVKPWWERMEQIHDCMREIRKLWNDVHCEYFMARI